MLKNIIRASVAFYIGFIKAPNKPTQINFVPTNLLLTFGRIKNKYGRSKKRKKPTG